MSRAIPLAVSYAASGPCRALHHDPVQLSPHQLRRPRRFGLALGRDRRQRVPRIRKPRARPGRLFLANLRRIWCRPRAAAGLAETAASRSRAYKDGRGQRRDGRDQHHHGDWRLRCGCRRRSHRVCAGRGNLEVVNQDPSVAASRSGVTLAAGECHPIGEPTEPPRSADNGRHHLHQDR